ncbi:MAG TPA: efflux RND transporter periplasmic adaptor subunit [Guyparkeria sp.]|nr:efflux RND transporter periplasmic adaptor subunit [Guyparkeria sp.]
MMKHAIESFRKPAAARRLAVPLIAALLSLGLSLSLTGCGGDRAEPHPEAGAGITVEGNWITVSAGKVDDTALYPGTVIASDRSPIASRMMGYLREINVREGETVEKDQVLLTIDQSDVTSQIQQAEAVLAKARSGLTNARSNYERFKRLYEDNAIPKQQFEQMKTAYEAARSDYNAAQAGLEQAQSQVGYAQIRAPFAGTIIQRMADPGQLATPGQPLLMLMGSGDREIQVEVDDQAFAALAEGDAIEVGYRRIDGSATSFTGQVLRLVDAADPITRTHSVRIAVPTDVPLSRVAM